MANILISFFSSTGEDRLLIFYESLMNAFKKNGNNVKYLVTNNFLDNAWNGNNNLKPTIDANKLINQIDTFKPDICIAFNNSLPENISNKIECPIVLWHADIFDYFNDKEKIKCKSDKYFYVCPFERDITTIKTELNVSEDKILKIIPASGVIKEDVDKLYDISFIGSMFNVNNIKKKLEQIANHHLSITAQRSKMYTNNYSLLSKLKNIVKKLKNNPTSDFNEILKEEGCLHLNSYLSKQDCIDFSSVQDRNFTLSLLCDLDLKVFGTGDYFNWFNVGESLPYLAMCHDNSQVYSLKHNQDIYNASKISINISHSQADTGFPWRVFDIMASNSCLISDKRSALEEFSQGYVNIPMYEEPFEARDLCKKILKDEKLREETVLASQECIEKKGRWEHRFKQIEEIIGVTLLNGHSGNTTISSVKSHSCINNEAENQN